MFTISKLVKPKTLEEAYDTLVSKKNNTILGGCAFLRLGFKRIQTAIDLEYLNLNYIKKDKEFIEIGAYSTLRDLETNVSTKGAFNGVLEKALKDIIGIQFRNVANIGATVFSKYGFSDVNTSLLCLDTEVELFKAGRMSLEEFLKRPYEKDILTKVFIKNNKRVGVYKSHRNSKSDFPVLNVAVSKLENDWKIVVGARPKGAKIALKASEALSKEENLNAYNIEKIVEIASNELDFGSNMRASLEYRKALCKVLLKRAIMEVVECR